MAPSTIAGAGQGLFTRIRIPVEATIGYYTGECITYEELAAGRFAGSDYLLGLTSKWLIAGEGPKANHTRYINHSAEPNALPVISNRWKTARIVAIRDIEPGEEIFFDYGEAYWEAAAQTEQVLKPIAPAGAAIPPVNK